MITTDDRDYIKDIHYNTAEEFLQSISYGGELYKIFNNNFIFRGHSSDKYKLLPTALRRYLFYDVNPISFEDNKQWALMAQSEYMQIESEAQLLFKFFQLCDNTNLYIPEEQRFRESFIFNFDYKIIFSPDNWIAKEYQELAALAQHHGVPTRLLDWSYDLNVALYFASSSQLRKMSTLKNLTQSEWIKYSQSQLQKGVIYLRTKGIKGFEEEDKLEIWALDTTVISADNKFALPLKIVRPRYYGNNNLAAQKGIFTYWQVKKPLMKNDKGELVPNFFTPRNTDPLDKQIVEYLKQHKVKAREYIYHITIPKYAATELYDYAKKAHCDASYLFPGYNGVAKCIEENMYIKCLQSNII